MLKKVPDLIAEIRKVVPCITAQEAASMCNKLSGTLIDVREPQEHAASSVKKAVNIPRGVLEMKINEVCPEASTPIFIHCATGGRATLAAEQLLRLGYENVWAISCKLDEVCNSFNTNSN